MNLYEIARNHRFVNEIKGFEASWSDQAPAGAELEPRSQAEAAGLAARLRLSLGAPLRLLGWGLR